MNFKIIFYLGLSLTTGILGKNIKIIGGEDNDVTETPYLASLRMINPHALFCTGSIISNKHIITAGHCIYNRLNNIPNIRIYTGTNSGSAIDGPIFKIEEYHFHPKFTYLQLFGSTYLYDLVIIKLDGEIKFDRYQQKINLPIEDANVNDTAIVVGWGMTSHPNGKFSERLRKASMKILDNSDCTKFHPFLVTYDQICAFQKKGVGICSGDSGSPLIINEVLVGVASFGLPCARGRPDIYVRVYYSMDFIRSIVPD